MFSLFSYTHIPLHFLLLQSTIAAGVALAHLRAILTVALNFPEQLNNKQRKKILLQFMFFLFISVGKLFIHHSAHY